MDYFLEFIWSEQNRSWAIPTLVTVVLALFAGIAWLVELWLRNREASVPAARANLSAPNSLEEKIHTDLGDGAGMFVFGQASSPDEFLQGVFKKADELGSKGKFAASAAARNLAALRYDNDPAGSLQALRQVQEIGPPDVTVALGIADLQTRLGNLTEAERSYLSIIEPTTGFAGEPVAPEVKAHACSGISKVYLDRGHLEKAEHYGREAIRIFGDLKDNKSQATCLYQLTIILRSLGKYDEVEKLSNYLFDNKSLLDEGVVAGLAANLAIISLERRAHDKAERLFHTAEEIYRKHNSADGLIAVTSNLGIIRLQQTRFPEAIEYFEKAVEISSSNTNNIAWANNHANLGIAYANLKKLEHAKYHFGLARDVYKKIGVDSRAAQMDAHLLRLGAR